MKSTKNQKLSYRRCEPPPPLNTRHPPPLSELYKLTNPREGHLGTCNIYWQLRFISLKKETDLFRLYVLFSQFRALMFSREFVFCLFIYYEIWVTFTWCELGKQNIQVKRSINLKDRLSKLSILHLKLKTNLDVQLCKQAQRGIVLDVLKIYTCTKHHSNT